MTPTPEQQHQAVVRVTHLLMHVEATMTGWVLQLDRDKVSAALEPVHELLDQFIPEGPST
jgi:hypothetical protein